MKIVEAIALMKADIENPGSVAIEDVNEAEQLGIEALKVLPSYRKALLLDPDDLLPGETEK